MSRAKTRRPGTRGGAVVPGRPQSIGPTDPFDRVDLPRQSRGKPPLPDDLPEAAEAALDDLLTQARDHHDDSEEILTRARAASEPVDQVDDDELMTMAVGRDEDTSARTNRTPKLPLPAPSTSPVPRTTPPPFGAVRPTPPPVPVARDSGTAGSARTTIEHTTSRARKSAGSIDETARLPADRAQMSEDVPTRAVTSASPFGDSEAAPMDESMLLEERALGELPVLRFAVFEDQAQLAAVHGAIVACGHLVAVAASNVSKIVDAIRAGSIDVVIVALPGGEEIIDAALALEPRRPIVLASLAGNPVEVVRRAHSAGADLTTTRPHGVDHLAPLLFASARLHIERRAALSARGAEQVLRARLDELADPEPRGLLPFEMFQRVLELEIKRAKRFEYPLSVALFAVEITPPPPPPGIRGILRARAGNALINTIRDIDIATQLDHERFLVLLPYTDLKGSAGLGRRVIAAVAAGDPVIAAGRSFPPRIVGAVAGAQPGQPVSFAKLMKDATRALEQARRDGAELAVQP